MAMSDKPSFLQGVDDTPEEKEINDVLRDVPEGNPTNDAQTETPSSSTPDTTVTPSITDDNAGDSTSTDDKPVNPSDTPVVPPTDAPATPDPKTATTPPEDKTPPEETPEQAVERQVQLKWGTFKTPADAEKAFKEMQRTLTRLTTERKQEAPQTSQEKKEQKDKLIEFSELAKTQAMIDVRVPDPNSYNLDDGKFDLASYMRDYTKALVLGVQQSMVGGKLGALQFGLLQQAMGEEYAQSQSQVEIETKSKAIENKIYTTYPIFKENEDVGLLLEQAIYGEAARRQREAEAAGKEMQPMTEQEYLQIAERIVKNISLKVEPKKQEPADHITASPTLQPTGAPAVSQEDKDVEDMMKVRNRSGSIF